MSGTDANNMTNISTTLKDRASSNGDYLVVRVIPEKVT